MLRLRRALISVFLLVKQDRQDRQSKQNGHNGQAVHGAAPPPALNTINDSLGAATGKDKYSAR